MIRRTALHLVVLSHLFVVSCSSSAPPPTTAVKRAIETKQYDVDFDTPVSYTHLRAHETKANMV